MGQLYEIEAIISDSGTIQLPNELNHLKNHKVKLTLVDKQYANNENWLNVIESHAIHDAELPKDYSTNLDHYLYGLPKKETGQE